MTEHQYQYRVMRITPDGQRHYTAQGLIADTWPRRSDADYEAKRLRKGDLRSIVRVRQQILAAQDRDLAATALKALKGQLKRLEGTTYEVERRTVGPWEVDK